MSEATRKGGGVTEQEPVTLLGPVGTGGWPLTIAGLSAVLALMLVLKPGTGTPTPDLTPFGHAAMGLSLLTLALGVAHMVQLRLHYRPSAASVSR